MADLPPPQPPGATPPATPGGQPPAEPPKAPEKKELTQAEIDSIVEDRLKRDRETREQKLAAELGMSLKEAKALIAAKKEAQEKEKTDLQKAQEKNDILEKALKARDLRDSNRSKVEALIAEKKIKLPDGATLADVISLVTGEDETAISESLAKLQKLFPFSAPAMPGSNPANPGGKPPNLDEQIQTARAEALKTGDWKVYNQLCMKKQTG